MPPAVNLVVCKVQSKARPPGSSSTAGSWPRTLPAPPSPRSVLRGCEGERGCGEGKGSFMFIFPGVRSVAGLDVVHGFRRDGFALGDRGGPHGQRLCGGHWEVAASVAVAMLVYASSDWLFLITSPLAGASSLRPWLRCTLASARCSTSSPAFRPQCSIC